MPGCVLFILLSSRELRFVYPKVLRVMHTTEECKKVSAG